MRSLFLQLNTLEALDKIDEAFGLSFETGHELGIFQASLAVEQLVNSGKEDAFWKDEGISICKNSLELLDWAQGAPHAFCQADEADGAMLKAFGEVEHVDEVFQYAGEAAVVFGGDDYQTFGLKHAFF